MNYEFNEMNGPIPGNDRPAVDDLHHPHLFNHVRQKNVSSVAMPELEIRESLEQPQPDLEPVTPERDRLLQATMRLSLPGVCG